MTKDNRVQSIVQIYSTGQHYDKWSREQDTGLRQQEAVLMQIHCPDVNVEICNLGCGAGRETFALHRMGYRHVRGVDCTPALLKIARRHNEEQGLGIQFDLATADNLPYPPETFDLLTMFGNLYGHITPRSARIRSLGEVRRVLKPGGRVLMTATSIYHNWLYFPFIKMLEIVRVFYNPHDVERGDKKMKAQPNTRQEPREVAWSHWFRPNEIPEDAQKAGLSVIQKTTVIAVCRKPKENSAKLHNQGRLVYVLQRPV